MDSQIYGALNLIVFFLAINVNALTAQNPKSSSTQINSNSVLVALLDSHYTELSELVEKALLLQTLEQAVSHHNITIFAPNNEALERQMDPEFKRFLLEPRNLKSLQNLLLYHIIPSRVGAKEWPEQEVVHHQTLCVDESDNRLPLTRGNSGEKMVGGLARVVRPDDVIRADGLIHGIERLLVPRSVQEDFNRRPRSLNSLAFSLPHISMEIVSSFGDSPYELLLKALTLIPITHYVIGFVLVLWVLLYNFLEFHIFQDLFSGFRGQRVDLTFNSCSQLYHEVVSKCTLLHGRYMSTPWLSSPHLQTTFLRFFGRPPVFDYRREVFSLDDGGIVALDWLTRFDVMEKENIANGEAHQDSNMPIVVVIPGLTSDSDSVYIKHLTFYMAKRGWNVVVSNHRGLGGVPLTTDFFYNGGWTADLRKVVKHIRSKSMDVPLFVVGTSLGANMMVKYLGEDGDDILIDGAAAVCCPWDLLLCDRFIGRNAVQRFYDKALGAGLKRYAKKHQQFFTRLSDWDGIEKARRVREFDTSGTCRIGKFDTADIYYRESSCVGYVERIKVPLLCISALDDPVCTKEAVIWDECRANKNVILATTQHGGHLGYFDGMDAKGVWWVRAVDEFLTVLSSSTIIHKQNMMPDSLLVGPQKSLTDKDPYIHLVKKTENKIHHVDNKLLQTNKIFMERKIVSSDAAKGFEANSSSIDSFIFILKRFTDQF